jgi:hypothetical protein
VKLDSIKDAGEGNDMIVEFIGADGSGKTAVSLRSAMDLRVAHRWAQHYRDAEGQAISAWTHFAERSLSVLTNPQLFLSAMGGLQRTRFKSRIFSALNISRRDRYVRKLERSADWTIVDNGPLHAVCRRAAAGQDVTPLLRSLSRPSVIVWLKVAPSTARLRAQQRSPTDIDGGPLSTGHSDEWINRYHRQAEDLSSHPRRAFIIIDADDELLSVVNRTVRALASIAVRPS